MCHATKRNNAGRNVNARTPPSCWPVGGDEEGRTARQEERQERRGRRRDREREQGERGTLPPYKKGGCECCVWSWTHPWVNALEPLRADDFSSLSVFACPPLSLSLSLHPSSATLFSSFVPHVSLSVFQSLLFSVSPRPTPVPFLVFSPRLRRTSGSVCTRLSSLGSCSSSSTTTPDSARCLLRSWTKMARHATPRHASL